MVQVNGNGTNGHVNGDGAKHARPHPQTTYRDTNVERDSFYGRLRTLYADKVLKTQLEQLKKQGSYDAFKLQWHPSYDIRRLKGGKTRQDGIPPSLFWESDVGKWIEAACYFLQTDGGSCVHADDFKAAIQDLVNMIESAQQPDGYLNIYFTVVDTEGRFKNLRDLHEMYNAGHLLEAALAHHQYTGSRQFLDVMIKNVDCFIANIGSNSGQLHGYPGHPELELAVLRLYALTQDPKHHDFASYLLSERGVPKSEWENEPFFIHEARERNDLLTAGNLTSITNVDYMQAHLPLHEQNSILGHSVRAFYLLTAAADYGSSFLDDAQRLYDDAVDNKMYATGGFGSEPRFEGFHPAAHRLPQSTGEGGCYAETCASIAAMMTSERILSHRLDGRVRDTMELCLLNAVLGGGSLDGKQFSYANKQATWGDEVATRNDWFEVCCCPPNLSRTLGMLGGYTWRADVKDKEIEVDIYLFVAATRTISLPGGATASITMSTEMPWTGKTTIKAEAPEGYTWKLNIPQPDYAENIRISQSTHTTHGGYLQASLPASASADVTFDLPVRLLSPHPLTSQDTLTVSRGPIVYTAESFDNADLEREYKHFEGVGIRESTAFEAKEAEIEGIPVVMLTTQANDAYAIDGLKDRTAYRAVNQKHPARRWKALDTKLTFVPWFARANRGGAGHVRTGFLRVDE